MAKDPIKKAENGTYYFRANLGFHPITGKQIQKYKSGFKTKKEAREAYSKLMLTSTEELTEKKQQLSFQQFIEETYLPWYKTQVKESTYLNRRSTIQKHFSYFYKMTVDEIEPINVQNWQLELAKEFSPNYIRIVQGMLSIAFDRAVVLGLAKKNPSRMIGNIKSKKTKVDFWTLDEFQKVISLLYKGDYYEHYLFISYWLLFMTGMRIGEAAALQWSDINFETGLLSITKTLYYKTIDEYKFVEPKTQASIRTIYIDTDTIKELKAWQEVLWSSFFVTLVAKKIVLINLCCRPCFIWGSITIITVWTNMIIINVCKFFYLLIECFLCCKLIQICAFILQGIEITLHRCIVVRISCFAHALCHIYRFAEFGKCFGRIL